MGEIADAMLTGDLCAGCGAYLGGSTWDVPLLCADCAADRRRAGHDVQRAGQHWQDLGPAVADRPTRLKVRCPTCGKAVKPAGLGDHARAAHGQEQPR
jgi:hypothetical protein